MKNKEFEKLLQKATYLAFLIPKKTHKIKMPIAGSIHIPSYNLQNKIPHLIGSESVIKKPLSPTKRQIQLKKLLRFDNTVKISLKEKEVSYDLDSYMVSKQTNNTYASKNLHLLSHMILYYERRFSNSFQNKTWRFPKLLQISKIRPLFTPYSMHPFFDRMKSSIRKINSNDTQSENSFLQAADSNAVSLEKQFSRRRNYRTSRPLHT